jgi:hypothetical protein
MIRKIVKSIFVLVCGITTATFAQNSERGQTTQDTAFKTINTRASNNVRVDTQVNWGTYKAYRFTPAVYEPVSSRHLLKPNEVRKVEASVDRSLHQKLGATTEVDGAVLEVRPVITSFRRTNTLLNLIGFAAIQAPISFGGASVRYELVDAGTGAEIGVITCKRNARPWNVYPWNALYNFEALGQGSVILKSDSATLRKDLRLLSKRSVKPSQDLASGAE